MKIRRALIRRIAESLLDQSLIWRPPVPIERIVQVKNIQLRRSASSDDSTSGFVIKFSGYGPVIGVNSRQASTRQRFTMAHELGHILLHDFDDVHVDNRFLIKMKKRDGESSKGEDVDEMESNLFAAEILMPKRFLEEDMASLQSFDLLDERHIKELADRYEVSPQALTFRLSYLGYLPKE